MKAMTKEPTVEESFVRHIEGHLSGDQVPICKICGKTIFEIYNERIIALIQSKRTVNQNDLHKWAIRIHDDSNLGQMHVLYMLREMLADLGIEVVSETTAEKKG